MPRLGMPASAIVDLRNLIAERFPRAALRNGIVLKTKVAGLDQLLGGGLPKNALTELVIPKSSAGGASLIHTLIQTAYADRYFLALIDGRDSFDPCSLALDHDCFRHLLWLRCTNAFQAVKAADFMLRDGNFPLVVVDLVLNPAEELRKIPATTWYRLQRLVETTSTACLVMSRYRMVSSAQLKIVLENSWSLADLDHDAATQRAQFRIERSQLRSSAAQK